jgi:membrane-associated HD superfamily phosphohydrolase
MSNYILHFKKIFYIILFSSAVWFISFSIFPENQVIKIEVGEISPNSFSAPRFLSVVDQKKTDILKEEAISNVPPVYSIDSSITTDVIDGVTEMFLTVIKSRTEEILDQSDDEELEQSDPNLIIINLTKSEQIQKIRSSVLFSTISTSAIEVLVEVSNIDKNNETNFLTQIEFEAKNKANEILSKGISNESLNQQRQSIVSNPPTLNLSSELYAIVPEARISSTVGEIIGENLIANQKLEDELWNEQKAKAEDAVENVTVQFFKMKS